MIPLLQVAVFRFSLLLLLFLLLVLLFLLLLLLLPGSDGTAKIFQGILLMRGDETAGTLKDLLFMLSSPLGGDRTARTFQDILLML